MPLAHHDLGIAVFMVAFAATLVVPFVLSRKLGWRVALLAVLLWSLAGFSAFYAVEPVSLPFADALGVALVIFAAPWLAAAAAGSLGRRRSDSDTCP